MFRFDYDENLPLIPSSDLPLPLDHVSIAMPFLIVFGFIFAMILDID
jgi:hypothetical protein